MAVKVYCPSIGETIEDAEESRYRGEYAAEYKAEEIYEEHAVPYNCGEGGALFPIEVVVIEDGKNPVSYVVELQCDPIFIAHNRQEYEME